VSALPGSWPGGAIAIVRQSLADVSLGPSELFLSGGLITPPNPKHHEDDQRSYEGGHDVSQRDRHSVQPWGKPKHSKQQATNEGSDKTHAQISEEAKAFTIPKWSSAQRGCLREARQ
jgi:hypothetical protein